MIKLWFSRFDNKTRSRCLLVGTVALLIAGWPARPVTARQSSSPTATLLTHATAAESALQFDVAADRLYQIIVEHPRSAEAWPARARLARLLALAGDLPAALLECQALRHELPADHAWRQPTLDLATLLARRMRASSATKYFADISAQTLRGLANTDEPSHIDVGPAGQIVLADAGQGRAYTVTADSAAIVPGTVDLTSAVWLGDGRLLTADKAGIAIAGAKAAWLNGTWAGKTRPLKKTRSLATMTNGDLLVIDKDYDGLLRCAAASACVPWGPPGKLRVVAIGASDFVFVLDDKPQTMRVLDHTGRVVLTIASGAGGARFGEIVDIAVDRAYGLYVLDKQSRRVDILTVRADRANAISVVPIGWTLVPVDGESGLKNPSAIGVMPNGAVLVAGRSAARLLRFQ